MEEEKKIKEENYVEEIAGQQKPEPQKVAIHVMPRKYAVKKKSSSIDQSKKIGILILSLGSLLLIVGVYLGYVYLIKPGYTNIGNVPNGSQLAQDNDQNKQRENQNNQQDKDAGNDFQDEEDDIIYDPAFDDDPLPSQSTSTVDIETGTTTTIDFSDEEDENGEFKTAADSDGDGLTDLEELLFDTNPNAPDSDGDGYDDLTEVKNLYNPAGSGKITDNPGFTVYENEYSYSFVRPKSWNIDVFGGNDSVMLQLKNNQFIQVIVQVKSENETIDGWYKRQFMVDVIDNERVSNPAGFKGVRSKDGLTVYLEHPEKNYIVTVTYNTGLENTLYYKNIFELIIESMQVH
jgi:hypothetical protein